MNVPGEQIGYDPDAPTASAEWVKHNLNRVRDRHLHRRLRRDRGIRGQRRGPATKAGLNHPVDVTVDWAGTW